jgi:predicted  nucleic acid-binding Zn-ribbon protein
MDMDNEKVSCETPEQTINRLTEENNKLMEEIKMLNDKLIEYTNMLKHIEYNVKLTVDQIKNDIFYQY